MPSAWPRLRRRTARRHRLDPHISPEAAEYQAARVAKARKLSEDAVRQLIVEHTEPPQLSLFGRPRVNVLALNRALDEVK
jgi:potassium-transporting ATPase KdpC subunit